MPRRDRVDLVRGALDAWLHPPTPSRIPAVAALVGGGLWTLVAAGVVFQPAPPDWPGYLAEAVPLALVAVAFLLVATLGCALRSGDRRRRRSAASGAIVTTLGYGVVARDAGGDRDRLGRRAGARRRPDRGHGRHDR